MTEILLYPTETLYALGVNALDPAALRTLSELKGRAGDKATSWLVRSIADIERYAYMNDSAKRIAEAFLPGPLTLVLQAREDVSAEITASDGTIGFRISSDKTAQGVIERYMDEHDAPLTCTSANVSGAPALPTPGEILQQFGAKAPEITHIVDDGPRKALASTIVRVVDGDVMVLREGSVTEREVRAVI